MSSRRSQGRKEVPAGAAGVAAAESKGKKAKTEAAGAAAAGAIAPPSHAIQKGTDSEGKAYKNLDELWKEQFEGQRVRTHRDCEEDRRRPRNSLTVALSLPAAALAQTPLLPLLLLPLPLMVSRLLLLLAANSWRGIRRALTTG
jgi:hypothetical protein